MKKQSLFLIAGVFFLVFTLSNGAKAAGGSDTTLREAQFSYSGIKQDMVFFKVDYANPESRKFMFEVEDNDGNVLYSQTFNTKDFSKTVCIPRIKDKSQVNFSIRAGTTSYKQSFTINPEIRLVDDYVVTKL